MKELIALRKFTKCYSGKEYPAVRELSLNIYEGDVFGFLGPNGAGKTTTVKAIVGLIRPTSGTISLFGATPDDREVKRRIGFLPEQPYFYQYLTGWEFLEMCADIFELEKKRKKQRIEEVLERSGLSQEAWHSKIRGYSKGMQQRLGLAQAILNDPELLILDEPMSGLDPLGRREVKDLILALKKEGKTIFFNSHILSDVEDLCTRVAIIDRGTMLLEGTVEKITKKHTISLEKFFIDTITTART